MLAYLLNLGILLSINAILAITLNFIMGFAGIFSLAHAIFFGVGAYTAAWVALEGGTSLFIAVPAAMAVTAVVSLGLALPALRVRGEYFVAASLGLQVIGVTVFSEWKSFTGGIGGVVGIPPVDIFGHVVTDRLEFLTLSVASLVLVILLTSTLLRSSFGRSLQAIRDSESAAHAFGKHNALLKTLSVAVSAAFAGLAGALYAFYMAFINVESFTLDTSALLMAMVIVGGTGTVFGPLVGTAVLMLLPSALTYLPGLPSEHVGSLQQIIYGLAMVLMMIFRPGGILGHRPHRADAKRRKDAPAAAVGKQGVRA